MIPMAIFAGLVLGLLIRWWAVPIVAFGWAAIIAVFVDATAAAAGGALGATNALVGVAPAVMFRRVWRAAWDGR
jgi:hypothetical protein